MERSFCFIGRRAVAFGTTLNRELLPLKVPPNRFGNELGLRGAPNRGPGCYDNAEVTKLIAFVLTVCFFSDFVLKIFELVREKRLRSMVDCVT